MTLDGLEKLLTQHFPKETWKGRANAGRPRSIWSDMRMTSLSPVIRENCGRTKCVRWWSDSYTSEG
jgi:hypothetical protein